MPLPTTLVPSLETLTRAFERGAASVRNAPPLDAVVVARKLASIAERIAKGELALPVNYAHVAGANAARDALRSIASGGRIAARVSERTARVHAFTQRETAMRAALATAIETARDHWISFDAHRIPSMGEGTIMIEALYLDGLTDAEVALIFPHVKRDARYKRKERALDYIIQHGNCSPDLVAYISDMRHMSTVRRTRAAHGK